MNEEETRMVKEEPIEEDPEEMEVEQQPLLVDSHQQLLPGIRPGVTSNYVMPYNLQRQGQQGQRMGAHQGGNSQQMQQQEVAPHSSPFTWHMMMQGNTNQGFRYMNARDVVDPPTVPQSIVGPIMPLLIEVSRVPVNPIEVQRPNPVPISTLISEFASAFPKERNEARDTSTLYLAIFGLTTYQRMLGEQLYPLVQRIEPEHVNKVTGMLLQMDQTEVLHLLESPDALKVKVAG
ncbi:hypothetical protein DITRI_Ditri05aG0161800 [Diplodiscus trichospermus]